MGLVIGLVLLAYDQVSDENSSSTLLTVEDVNLVYTHETTDNNYFDYETPDQNQPDTNITYNYQTLTNISFKSKKRAQGPKDVNLIYTIDSNNFVLTATFYKGENDYLAGLDRQIWIYDYEPNPTSRDFIMKILDEQTQKEFMQPLVNYLNDLNMPNYKKVRVAVSLVQHIPYDWNGFTQDTITGKHPYEVLYTNTGVCSEKSRLLVYLLRELGYGMALFDFNAENHEAVGIKCPTQYSFRNSGYCFIESTTPSIITDSNKEYVAAGKLISNPEIVITNYGESFDEVSEDYRDAQNYSLWDKEVLGTNMNALENDYSKWINLRKKYGFEESSCDTGFTLCNGSCWVACTSGKWVCNSGQLPFCFN